MKSISESSASPAAIDPQRIKELSTLSPWRTFAAIALDWAIIAGVIALANAGIAAKETLVVQIALYAVAVAIIAGRMHGFGGVMHDIAHGRFMRNTRLADWIGDVLLAWPVLASVDGYRSNHLAHHSHTNTDQDPDWVIKLGRAHFTFPQSLFSALSNALGYAIGVNAVRDMRDALARMKGGRKPSTAKKVARLSFYAAVVLGLTLADAWMGFLLYWVVPFFTAFFFFLYVRSVAEHFGPTMMHADALTASRTVIPKAWERWFFCPHNLNYHLDHHLYPSVPFYNLPKLHSALMADEAYVAQAHITHGYCTGLLKEVWLAGAITPRSPAVA